MGNTQTVEDRGPNKLPVVKRETTEGTIVFIGDESRLGYISVRLANQKKEYILEYKNHNFAELRKRCTVGKAVLIYYIWDKLQVGTTINHYPIIKDIDNPKIKTITLAYESLLPPSNGHVDHLHEIVVFERPVKIDGLPDRPYIRLVLDDRGDNFDAIKNMLYTGRKYIFSIQLFDSDNIYSVITVSKEV